MSESPSIFDGQVPVASQRIGVRIADLLRRAIIEGRLQPGDLLREEQLARELGTSRTPVREALIELRNEGLVETGRDRRATVRRYDSDELRDIYHLRASLEGFAARIAAERASEAALRRLDASNDRFHARAQDDDEHVNELISENLVFHGLIAEAAGIAQLERMINQVMVIPMRYRAYVAYRGAHRGTIETHHRSIADALRRRDAEAAQREMEAHVRWTGDLVVAEHLGDEGGRVSEP